MNNSKLPYEILLRGKPDGSFSGGHVVFFNDDGSIGEIFPLGTKDHPWPEALGQVNTLLASKAGEADALKQQLALVIEERNALTQKLFIVENSTLGQSGVVVS